MRLPALHGFGRIVLLSAWVIVPGIFSACSTADTYVQLPDRVDYNFHVRPILSNSCFVCHGPDPSTREVDLRLDLRETATARRATGGRAIVPGSARRSKVVRRISAEDVDERMPPADTNHRLTAREIAIISKWIDQGAEYKPPWALIRPVRPPGSVHSIDYYINERLAERDLAPAPPANKEALARRASFVLTGLPPSPELLQSFVEDSSAAAYERLLDHFLASPRYGERWARHWMDLVRYAESKGHEFDFTIEGAWRYRDYLIRSFNADLPYDEFVTEHLAGDLLDQPRFHPSEGYNESVIATSYLALGEGKHSPVDTRLDEADRIDNIIDVTFKTFQGLTVACARCHDHKFDPVPTSDYYSFYGIFESTRFAYTPLLSSSQQAWLDSIQSVQQSLRQSVGTAWKQSLSENGVSGRFASNPDLRSENPAVVRASHTTSSGAGLGAVARQDSTQHWRLIGDFRHGTYDGWFPHGPGFGSGSEQSLLISTRGQIDSLAFGMASSRHLATGVPGAFRSPTFTLDMDSIHVVAAGRGSVVRIIVDNFQLINPPIFQTIQAKVESSEPTTYRFGVNLWKGRKAYIELMVGSFKLQQHINHIHRILRDDSSYVEATYALAFSGTAPVLSEPPIASNLATQNLERAVGAWAEGHATMPQLTTINYALKSDILPKLDIGSSLDLIEKYKAQVGDVKYFIGVTEGDAIESPVFVRGNHQTLGDHPVPHRFLSAISDSTATFGKSANGRLDMARSIVDPSNPLTARVMVNRLWHHAFGRGIVKTVDNLGAQGSLPTHPELFDYLALRFVEQGWSIKAILREILLSEAFRRSTQPSPEAREHDPQNLLLSHYPVRRLDAEAIRDAILAVSGRLDTTMYGEPVPTHLTEFMNGPGRPEESGPLDGSGRRTVYLEVRRNFLSPMMLAFDRPIPFSTFGARNTTNVPAQSLTMLNDPFVAQQARVWADKIVTMDDTDLTQRIQYIYRRALSRDASRDDSADGLAYLETEASRRNLNPAAALNSAELWAAYCHVVFNLKEFLYLF